MFSNEQFPFPSIMDVTHLCCHMHQLPVRVSVHTAAKFLAPCCSGTEWPIWGSHLTMHQTIWLTDYRMYPLPGLTQPSILKWSVNQVPACLAGVKAGCIHLCQVAGNTVIQYGKWHSIAVSWSSPLTAYSTFTFRQSVLSNIIWKHIVLPPHFNPAQWLPVPPILPSDIVRVTNFYIVLLAQ